MDPPAISRHKCLVYEGHPSEQLPVVSPLLLDGLRERRRCLYLGDEETIALVKSDLARRGLDVSGEMGRGALVFSSDRSHLDGSGFDPKAMVDMLRRTVDEAVRDGFAGLWATGDMRWELGADANFERLREYEARLELAFRELPLSGVCQYHRDAVPARAIRDALLAHRSAYVDGALNRDNLFYLPPELALADGPERQERLAEWMSRQLARVLRAERERDRTLADLESRVRERTADLEAFGYSLSHDLRAPLRSIHGFASAVLAADGAGLDAAGRADLVRVVAASERMSRLIDALLGLYQLGRAELSVEAVDLTRLARETAAGLRAADPGRSADVAVEAGLQTRGDPRLLRALLENLLGNAWKFTARTERARIEFGASRRGDETVFRVSDNGPGFDPSQAHRLFKPFQRLHSADDFPGSGIGLASVRRIVARHGGEVWAEPRPGGGAIFSFTLGPPGPDEAPS